MYVEDSQVSFYVSVPRMLDIGARHRSEWGHNGVILTDRRILAGWLASYLLGQH